MNGIDPTNPQHYKMHEMECIDEMEVLFGTEAVIDFCNLNAWKYRERAPYKGSEDVDNRKADWYINKSKELQEKLNKKGDKIHAKSI